MLTVLTWFWEQPGGRTKYTARHVNIWAAMVRRHLTLPHRLACVTDLPQGIDPDIHIIDPPGEFEDIDLPTWGDGRPQCLRRVAMFALDAAERFGERFVSMDMDCVIAGSLDPLFDRPEDIVLYASPRPAFSPAHRPYNGSMLLMTAGCRSHVYADLTPAAAQEAGNRYLGSDQAWISHALGPGEATWSHADGVEWWGRWTPRTQSRVMFFPGYPKPWDLIGHDWVRRHYHGKDAGRCLILGYADSLWGDLAAVRDKRFDAVIASPEAAEHWPGEVLEIAETDMRAEQMARMYGFDEIVFCGRSEKEAA